MKGINKYWEHEARFEEGLSAKSGPKSQKHFAPTNKRERAGVRQECQEALHELYHRMILFYNHIHFNVQQAILILSTMACCRIVFGTEMRLWGYIEVPNSSKLVAALYLGHMESL